MQLTEFESRDAASRAAAGRLAARLEDRLGRDSEALLVVSGGSTPVTCFRDLSCKALAWDRVRILLSDERWVAPESDDSNERLVRVNLLRERAQGAQLLPAYRPQTSIEARCDELNREIGALPLPFAASLLGMGNDGHFASLFPDADNLQPGLDLCNADYCIPVHTTASPLPRVSLTLAALARSDEILLLAFGREKRRLLESAWRGSGDYPVASLLALDPASVYWAP